MRVSYYSLGCKVNNYETLAVAEAFQAAGYEVVDFLSPADVTIINTCAVTQTAAAKSRKYIRRALAASPAGKVAVMGCYAQLAAAKITEMSDRLYVFGTQNRSLIKETVLTLPPGNYGERLAYKQVYDELALSNYDQIRAYVKIQDGCNEFCTFCIIPHLRGFSRSRDQEKIVAEIARLVAAGYKEIVLTGINTGAYGLERGSSLLALLAAIEAAVPGKYQIRISSIEETEVTEELLAFIAAHPGRFARHLHVPLQAGSAAVLKKMGRPYDPAGYAEKLALIRRYLPDVNITSDILTGFWGEGEAEFTEGYRFIEAMAFGELHVFPYSERPLTRAVRFSGEPPSAAEKSARVQKLLALNEQLALSYRAQYVGQTLEVLVEKSGGRWGRGHTSNYLVVEFPYKGPVNQFIKVKILTAGYPVMKGAVLSE